MSIRYIFNLFFILLFNISNAQNFLTIFDSYNTHQDFDWRGMENRFESHSTKHDFVKYAKEHNLMVDEFEMMDANKMIIPNHFKGIDINGDDQLDIIYSGPSGGEPNVVKIFLNTGSDYELVFYGYQGIVKVIWKNERLDQIFLHDWGCCADIRQINSVYQATYNDGTIPEFNIIYQSVEPQFMAKPKVLLEEPIRFSINNDGYKLRLMPNIDDENYYFPDGAINRKGNTIGFLNSGYKGTAFGSKVDETGRVWWYVEINNQYEILDNVLKMDDLEQMTNVVGWISSRYVTKID